MEDLLLVCSYSAAFAMGAFLRAFVVAKFTAVRAFAACY
jgi:hypothetical protein